MSGKPEQIQVKQAELDPPIMWGDTPDAERKRELQDIVDAWNAPGADHGERRGPFDGVELTGAEVYWLAEQSGPTERGAVPNLQMAGADLIDAHLAGANLIEARP